MKTYQSITSLATSPAISHSSLYSNGGYLMNNDILTNIGTVNNSATVVTITTNNNTVNTMTGSSKSSTTTNITTTIAAMENNTIYSTNSNSSKRMDILRKNTSPLLIEKGRRRTFSENNHIWKYGDSNLDKESLNEDCNSTTILKRPNSFQEQWSRDERLSRKSFRNSFYCSKNNDNDNISDDDDALSVENTRL